MTHFTRFETTTSRVRHVHKPPSGAYFIYMRARTESLFIVIVATFGQQVPVAQRFSAVVCDVDVHGSVLTVPIIFCFFFSQRNLSFLASSNILDDPWFRTTLPRSLARAEGPV